MNGLLWVIHDRCIQYPSINVRCYSNSEIIVRRSEVTLRARNRLMQCSKFDGDSMGQCCTGVGKHTVSGWCGRLTG